MIRISILFYFFACIHVCIAALSHGNGKKCILKSWNTSRQFVNRSYIVLYDRVAGCQCTVFYLSIYLFLIIFCLFLYRFKDLWERLEIG